MRTLFLLALCPALLLSEVVAQQIGNLGFDPASASRRSLESIAVETHLERRYGGRAYVAALEDEIDISRARIQALNNQLDDYDTINRFGTGNALALTADRVRLDLEREEIIHRRLRSQQLEAQRQRRVSRRDYHYWRMLAQAAAAQQQAADEPEHDSAGPSRR